MATLGLCTVCRRPALYTCFRCGRTVCTLHYDSRKAVCSECARGRSVPPARRGAG